MYYQVESNAELESGLCWHGFEGSRTGVPPSFSQRLSAKESGSALPVFETADESPSRRTDRRTATVIGRTRFGVSHC